MTRKWAYFLTAGLLYFGAYVVAQAVTLQWDVPVGDPLVAGYEIHYGAQTGTYDAFVDVPGATTNTTVAPNPGVGQTYFYAARSVNADKSLVSPFSNEVSLTIPPDVTLTPPTNLVIAPDPVDSPLAEYLFEGNTMDTSGNALDGTLIGGTYVTGYDGQGLQFDGVAGGVDLGGMDISGEAMTLAAWVYINNPVLDGRIVSKATGVNEADHYWMLSTTTDGSFRFRLKTGGVTTTLVSTAGVVPLATWTHLMAVYDGATMALFVDGTQVAEVAKAGVINEDPAVPVMIGAQPQGDRVLDGIVDDVLFYDQVVTPW